MTPHNPLPFWLIVASLFMFGPAAQASPVQLWIFSPGAYGGDTEPAPTAKKSIELDALPRQKVQRLDAQYGATFNYRGVPLRELITHYAPPAQVDLLLLYFRNGIVIPLPFRDANVINRLNPFIALEMGPTAQGPFTPRFPSIDKKIGAYVDVPQVMFSDNKLVVSERWHPDVPAQAEFSPWTMAGSLSEIGFADSRAYYRQLEPSPDVQKGFDIYRQSCQYCHGVHKIGASFGWDFGQSIDLHPSRNSPMALHFYIQYRVGKRAALGQMPVLKHITEEQAVELLRWMRAVSTTSPRPYSGAR
jgi:mono/diheme cytochrome c family protein